MRFFLFCVLDLTDACIGLGIFLSDMGLLGMGYILHRLALIYGWKAVFMYYFVPYVVSNPHLLPLCCSQLISILAL